VTVAQPTDDPHLTTHTVRTDARGRFEMSYVAEGEVRLRAVAEDSLARTEATVTAAIDGPEVTLTMDAGHDWRVRIDEWARHGTGAEPYATVYEGTPSKDTPHVSLTVGADGVVVFRGVRKDRPYTVWVQPFGDGVHVLRGGLRWSEAETVLAVARGASITGRVTGPAKVQVRQVWAVRDGMSATGAIDADGRYQVAGLPAGPWDILVSYSGSGGNWIGRATASPGESLDLTLERERHR
jgi:hypothetical protein